MSPSRTSCRSSSCTNHSDRLSPARSTLQRCRPLLPCHFKKGHTVGLGGSTEDYHENVLKDTSRTNYGRRENCQSTLWCTWTFTRTRQLCARISMSMLQAASNHAENLMRLTDVRAESRLLCRSPPLPRCWFRARPSPAPSRSRHSTHRLKSRLRWLDLQNKTSPDNSWYDIT